jgi:DNA-binding XRE family transcriptional regulator
MTQEELAKAVGVHRQTVIAWESNENKPRGKAILELGKILQVNSGWLKNGFFVSKGVDFELPAFLSIMNQATEATNSSIHKNMEKFEFKIDYSQVESLPRRIILSELDSNLRMLAQIISRLSDDQVATISSYLREAIAGTLPKT